MISRMSVLSEWRRSLCLAVAILTLGLLFGCGGGESSQDSASGEEEAPKLLSIAVSPSEATVAVGTQQTFSVTGEYSDGSSSAVTEGIIWSTSSSDAATVVASTGVATGRSVGSANIIASVGAIQNQATIIVKAPYSVASAGSEHSLAIRADGTLWAWGGNLFGQVGDGSLKNISKPIMVGTAKNWVALASGEFHNLALRSDGTLWSWGYNLNGQLGDGTPGLNKSVPAKVGNLTTWTAVAAGKAHSVALKKDGTLWTWGRNFSGQLGDGTLSDRSLPVQIKNPINPQTKWIAIAAGAENTFARDVDGNLWAWGSSQSGLFDSGQGVEPITTPTRLGGGPWVATAAGRLHALTIRADGALFSGGDNAHGQLGLPGKSGPTAGQVGTEFNWSAIAAGDFHSLGIRTDGTLWSWGKNEAGQLGDGSNQKLDSPKKVGNESTWIKLSAGATHSLAIKADGTLWSAGLNTSGQLGSGTMTSSNTFIEIK